MKRVIMAAALLVSTATVFATETKGVEVKKENRTEMTVNVKDDECSVTMSAKVGPAWFQVEVKCTYTAPTCKEAIGGATKCLDEARKAIQ